MRVISRRLSAALMAISVSLALNAASAPTDSVDPGKAWIPEIGGTLRGRFEYADPGNLERFALKNARLLLQGHPVSWFSYLVQFDLCNSGKYTFLDAFGTFTPTNKFYVRGGQMPVPFLRDKFMIPGRYLFADPGFPVVYMGSQRRPGIKVRWTPYSNFWIEGGAYNSTANTDHNVWQRAGLNYGSRANATFGMLNIEVGAMSIVPSWVRVNALDLALELKPARGLTLDAEATTWHYTHRRMRQSWTAMAMADYAIPVRGIEYVNEVSFQARWDYMTNFSNALPDAETNSLTITAPQQQRATVGVTAGYVVGKRYIKFRVNYEHFFFKHGYVRPDGAGTHVVAELAMVF